jgi:hypothetical protein
MVPPFSSPSPSSSSSSSSLSLSSPSPFRFLSSLGVDALRLVLRFATAPQTSCLAELAATRDRAGGGSGCGANRLLGGGGGGGGEGSGGTPAEMFGPLKQFDPRTRSLPYLLRQSEEEERKRQAQKGTKPGTK